jgi:hypothetical protein
MTTRTIAIISAGKVSFATITDPILLAMQDRSTRFLLDDREIQAIRLLSSRGFRNVTIFHIGTNPRISTKIANGYTMSGGHLTYTEIEEEIKALASEVIS